MIDKGAARCEKHSEVLGVIIKIKSKDTKIEDVFNEDFEVIESQGVLSDEDKKLLQIE